MHSAPSLIQGRGVVRCHPSHGNPGKGLRPVPWAKLLSDAQNLTGLAANSKEN